MNTLSAHSNLSPSQSQKVRRKGSTRRARAGSHLPPYSAQDSHDLALQSIRSFLKGTTSYDAFPVSFRLIVLDTKLNVKKALQCLLLNGISIRILLIPALTLSCRRCVCSSLEQRKVSLRWHAHSPRHHPSNPILLSYRFL